MVWPWGIETNTSWTCRIPCCHRLKNRPLQHSMAEKISQARLIELKALNPGFRSLRSLHSGLHSAASSAGSLRFSTLEVISNELIKWRWLTLARLAILLH